jgi:NAD(P)-dependent dehydrogenase (short-subunit alcohol dehydrogenase family)
MRRARSRRPSRVAVAPVAALGLLAARELWRRRRRWDLRGRTVLITGGSRGLGLLIARELVAQGARVAVGARDEETLDRARRDLMGRGGLVAAISCDVTDPAAVERLVRATTDRLGPIDALVSCAGTITVGPAREMRREDFQRAMDTNFWGALHAILAVLPGMRARGAGRIVNVASIGGRISVPHLLPYSASKFALVGLSEGLRAELAPEGIQVSTICPGLMRTGSPRHAWFKGQHRAEYAWFSVADALPLVSMDAGRAARQVVDALRHGVAHRTLSLPAKAAGAVHGLLPGTTGALLALVSRLLPGPDGRAADAPVEGVESASAVSPSVLTTLGERAAARNNQIA